MYNFFQFIHVYVFFLVRIFLRSMIAYLLLLWLHRYTNQFIFYHLSRYNLTNKYQQNNTSFKNRYF
ncbi:hypothetical protein BDF19DRAFT_123360 [Syncephalis fuscata]|nr:hypothetical protein BDF19DRAFT_123360 [Syncephalis fuscata]